MKAIDILRQEHRIGLLMLKAAVFECRRVLETGHPDAEKLEKIIDFFFNFVERCHHVKEEQHLFPRLQQAGGEAAGLVAELREEHEASRRLIRAVTCCLFPYSPSGARLSEKIADDLTACTDLLRTHVEKEETRLFPAAEAILSAADDEALLAAFKRVEAEAMAPEARERYSRLAKELGGKGG